MQEKASSLFQERFGAADGCIFVRAPGRTNLIGEHVDYQGGHVLPFAVDRYVWAYGRKRSDDRIRIFSHNYKQLYETAVADIAFQKGAPWANYVLGVAEEFKKAGIVLSGFEAVIGGDVPEASGLSSSAAIEICTAVFLMKILGVSIEPVETVKLARRAENDFVGVSCGIMDQFAVHLSKQNHALLLNCKTLEYGHVPLELNDYELLLVNTKKQRQLFSSCYNERVAQVAEGLQLARKYSPAAECLADITPDNLRSAQDDMSLLIYQRTRHIVEENARVLKAAELLRQGDIPALGELLYQSHASLKDLYEVSCDELDFIVDTARRQDGVAGARMTGAGFGGCAIVLVKKDRAAQFKQALSPAYEKRFSHPCEFYDVHSVSGAFFQP